MNPNWDPRLFSTMPCRWLSNTLKQPMFMERNSFPSAKELSIAVQAQHGAFEHRFVNQSPNEKQHDYYENQIVYDKVIPTRADNWHDFMNAMIWFQFPQSKSVISQLHAQDIAEFGLTPRTPRRDRLTHFDECGLLLVVEESSLDACRKWFMALCTHQWSNVFQQYQAFWHTKIHPCLFGHATAEMLLNPFIGLTAKWVLVPVENGFHQCDISQQFAHLDERLCDVLLHYSGFASKNVLRPLPVLGIPDWYGIQTHEFYANSAYFRQQREGVALSEQYPPRWPLY